MVESDSLCVAQQDDVSQLPHNRIEALDLLLRKQGNHVKGLATACEFTLGEDVRCRGDIWIEMMFGGASAPRESHVETLDVMSNRVIDERATIGIRRSRVKMAD